MEEFKVVKTGLENMKCILRWYYSWVFYWVIEEVKIYNWIQMFKIRGRRYYRWKAKKWISIDALAEYWLEFNSETKIDNETVKYVYDINQISPCPLEVIEQFEKIRADYNR